MDTAEICKANIVSTPQDDDELEQLLQSLPKETNWLGAHLYFFQGFWCPLQVLNAVISFQKHFQALDSDIIVSSFPKCGTTWLKALTFSVVNRHRFTREENPLLNLTPHQLVRFFEYDLYLKNPSPDLENGCLYKPRLLATHIPFASLPTSIKDSNCKIVYICRNPMDMFISLWLVSDKLRLENVEPVSLDEAFERFCHGIYGFGSFFDHVLGYWKASQQNPNKILCLQYEDLKEDISSCLKSLAMFLGVPFSEEEDKQGLVEEIAKFCSFGNLKELEANKNGVHSSGIPNKNFFRKAKVGDWSNYLTPFMVDRMEKLIQEKLDKSGFTFKLSCKTSKDATA